MFNVLKFKSFYIFLIISSKWTKRLHATALKVLLHKWSVNHAHRGGIAAAALENQMEGHGDSISLFTLKKKKKTPSQEERSGVSINVHVIFAVRIWRVD